MNRKIIALSILAVAAAITLCYQRNAPTKPRGVAVNNTVVEAKATPPKVTQVTSKATPAATANVGNLKKILPQINQPIKDWRNFSPKEIVIAPEAGLPAVVFTQNQVTTDATSTIWVGEHANPTFSLVGVATSDGWDAVVSLGTTGQYEVHVRGENAVVIKPAAHICGNFTGLEPEEVVLNAQKENAQAKAMTTAVANQATAASASTTLVDVMFFYSTKAVDAVRQGIISMLPQENITPPADPHVLITSTLKARLISANLILERSQVNFRWNCAGVLAIPNYAGSGDIGLDRFRLKFPNSPVNFAGVIWEPTQENNNASSFVLNNFANAKADQWVLVSMDDLPGLGGWGDAPGHTVSIVWISDYVTLAHELAHNFGCLHDRQVSGLPDTAPGYAYGYRFRTPTTMFGTEQDGLGVDVGTVMSYGNLVSPYFSNPRLQVKASDLLPTVRNNNYGGLLGPNYDQPMTTSAQLFVMGIPLGQPNACDNARWLDEKAAEMAAFQNPTVPEISVQPASTRTVATGSLLTLSLTAYGSGLNFQWRRNGIDIPGATSATSTVPVAEGTYDCVVWNSIRTLTSTPTVVTVRAPALPRMIGGLPNPTEFMVGENLVLDITATDTATYQWQRDNKNAVGGSVVNAWKEKFAYDTTTSTLTIPNATCALAGIYTATATNTVGTANCPPAVVGVTTPEKFVGDATLVSKDVKHPNGNIFDQVLLTGPAEAITADAGQMTRTSFIDPDGDIVQVEFSGAGTLTIALENAGQPASPTKYNQPSVAYVKGRARIVIIDADETTNVSIFSVGRATAFDPTGAYDIGKGPSTTNDPAKNGNSLFEGHPTATYDGIADVAYVAIGTAKGRFGGLRAANVRFSATHGFTGVYAENVAIGALFIGDIDAQSEAVPSIQIGSCPDVRITGGDLSQSNGKAVQLTGITTLRFTPGSNSHGVAVPQQTNQGVLIQGGVNVTATVVKP